TYGTVILGQPFAAASLASRLQALASVPLMNTADFESGVGFRVAGATVFPRQMAMGAIAGDAAERLVREEARITAVEARALGVHGLLYTDSLSMDAITKMVSPGEAAVRAVAAGVDQVLHSPDPVAAFAALKRAVEGGSISRTRLNEAVDRILRAKASLGLHQRRTVDLDAIPQQVGGRVHDAVAREASARSMTLVKDDRGILPLRLARDTPILC